MNNGNQPFRSDTSYPNQNGQQGHQSQPSPTQANGQGATYTLTPEQLVRIYEQAFHQGQQAQLVLAPSALRTSELNSIL